MKLLCVYSKNTSEAVVKLFVPLSVSPCRFGMDGVRCLFVLFWFRLMVPWHATNSVVFEERQELFFSRHALQL